MSSALITRREYTNLFRPETTGFLLGNVNDVITCEIDFELQIKTTSSYSNPFRVQNISASEIRITRATGSFLDEGFISGATVTIDFNAQVPLLGSVPATMTATVTSVNQTLLIVNPSSITPPTITSLPDGDYPDNNNGVLTITSNSTVEGIELNYNFVKNSQLNATPLTSLIDGTTPFFTKSGVDATVLTYIDLVPIGYQSGASFLSAKIKGRGIASGVQKFTLQLIYLITPAFTTLNDFINSGLPVPFFDTECITDVFVIKMLPQYNNPNISISTDSTSTQLLGNTGWFDENYNGGTNNYSVTNVEFLNSLGVPVSGIQTNEDTSFSITIDQPGNSGTSEYKFGFMWIPNNLSSFQKTNLPNYKNCLYNGLDDTSSFTFSTAPGSYSGQTNASGAQLDIDIISMSASGDSVTIEGVFKPNAAFQTYFDALDDIDRKYILWISCADETLSTSLSDRVSLLLQFGEFKVPSIPFATYDVENKFLNPVQPNSQSGIDIYEGANEDEVVAKTLVRVDVSNNDIIEEVVFLIQGYNISTGDTFEAEKRLYNTSGFPVQSGIQQIAISDLRGFKMKAGEEKNAIILERSPGDDVGNKKGYRFYYPFRLRWEDWIQNINVPGDFYNVNELNNNFNQNWANKALFNSWRIAYVLQMRVNRAGTIINTQNSFQFLQRTYDESAVYDAAITHYDDTATISLYTGLDADGIRTNAIYGTQNTLVRCEFTLEDPLGDVGDISQYFGIIRIEPYQGAGETDIMWLNTHKVNESVNNILIPITGVAGDGPTITKISATQIRLECLIDYTKLNPKIRYKTSARLGCADIDLGKYAVQYSLKYD